MTGAVTRAPFSRPNTAATGRPERPDPCTDPPTVTIDPTRVLPVLPDGRGDARDTAGAAPPRSARPPGGGARVGRRVLVVGSAAGAAVGVLGCGVLAARALTPAGLGRAVAVVALVAVTAGLAAAGRRDRGRHHRLRRHHPGRRRTRGAGGPGAAARRDLPSGGPGSVHGGRARPSSGPCPTGTAATSVREGVP